MLRTGSVGKVLAVAAMPLLVGGLPQASSALLSRDPGAVELVGYLQDDDGSEGPADSWGLWTPRAPRDVSSASNSGGVYLEDGSPLTLEKLRRQNQSGRSQEGGHATEPDYGESVIDEIKAFTKKIVGSVTGDSKATEAGPFSDSPDYWREIYYKAALAAATQTGKSAGSGQDVFNNPSNPAPAASNSGLDEPRSVSPAPATSSDPARDLVPTPSGGEPITTPDYGNSSPQAGRSKPTSGDDSDDPKPGPKSPKNGSAGK